MAPLLGEWVDARAIDLNNLVMLRVVKRALDQLLSSGLVGEHLADVDVQLPGFSADILGQVDLGEDSVGVYHLRLSLVDVPLSHTLQKYASPMLQKSARKRHPDKC